MNARIKLKKLRQEIETTLVIHYSCENLSDDNEGYSPRITSIAVQHVDSKSTYSFSIHLLAERERISREDIGQHYDQLEAKMLQEFYEFVEQHQSSNWVHWNMRNINYGFEALEHRYKVLTKNPSPPRVPDSRRFNLSYLIIEIYGNNCVPHPRMESLMKLNGEKPKDFLTGREEVEAFQKKEYLKLHASTLSKVGWFQKLLLKLLGNKIKTQHSNLPHKIDQLMESLPVKVLGFIGIIFTLITGIAFIFEAIEKAPTGDPQEAEIVKPQQSNEES